MNDSISRRPIQARDTRWAASTARWLSRVGFRPNPISLLSILFGALAGTSFAAVGIVETTELKCGCFVLAAVGIQLRLLCNLFDGMVAVEGGFRTKSGELFNELPDRFSDAFIMVGSGYAFAEPAWLRELAWAAAVLAIIAAYVRTLGASMGAGQQFLGPMAKQHRMAAMTFAALANAVAIFFTSSSMILLTTLSLIATGTLITIGRRCRAIIQVVEKL
ncbi:MAG: CDP-alcohol phosphatidyltransferase family protein [Planctomycetia bacterium]|nr:CDP-alcohol phosphatidyltransferase family protein [Planctomycetia bacterium]